jgi:hypothetical protein
MRCPVVRLSVEPLEGRALMSAVAPVPPPPGQAAVAFAAPVGSDKGSFVGDGKWEGRFGSQPSTPATQPVNSICAVWHGD